MRYEATRRDLCEMYELYIELSLDDVNKVTHVNCSLCHLLCLRVDNTDNRADRVVEQADELTAKTLH